MRIQHNILAMNAYRNYNTNTSALAKNLEKLSSGYKINRAGDDAAGLAISEKMRAQITGLNAAQKNVKDGISLVKTAEGAMQEIQDMLNRMDYLATQSANGTYDDPVDRLNLNKEMEALKDEINRIADSANFNGIKLLDGSITGDYKEGTSKTDVLPQQVEIATEHEHYQTHKAGDSSSAASFKIDLKQALEGAKATGTIAAGNTFDLKITVGTQEITVKCTAAATIANGAIIDFNKVRISGSITVNGAATTAATLTSTGVGGAQTTAKFDITVSNGVLTFTQTTAKTFDVNMSVTIVASGGMTLSVNGSANSGNDAIGPVSYNCHTQDPHNGVSKTGTQLAHAHFDLTNMVDTLTGKDGYLQIDKQKITFSATTTSVTTSASSGVVGIQDLMIDDGNGNKVFDTNKTAELARRIAQAAYSNNTFTVGVGTNGTTISLEEKYDFYTNNRTDENLMDSQEKIEAKLKFGGETNVSTAASGRKGLNLQIGDTSDSFNQLEVKIGDMHVSAMGTGTYVDEKGNTVQVTDTIDTITIATAASAKNAINVIKNAINYVSSIRGDLGAIQNRLEHTANNLSVMAENIQDAESTIRDTDIAEEMMSYTKNNILVQSAQAMLAQANAVPQGVLQLLG